MPPRDPAASRADWLPGLGGSPLPSSGSKTTTNNAAAKAAVRVRHAIKRRKRCAKTELAGNNEPAEHRSATRYLAAEPNASTKSGDELHDSPIAGPPRNAAYRSG